MAVNDGLPREHHERSEPDERDGEDDAQLSHLVSFPESFEPDAHTSRHPF